MKGLYSKRKFHLSSLLLAVALLFSCEGKLEDLNVNPNEPVEVSSVFIMTNSQIGLIDRLNGGFENLRFGMILSQFWSQQAQGTEESRFQFRSTTNNTFWNDFYIQLNNLEEVVKIEEEANVPRVSSNRIAVARIMQAWAYQILTDVYGPIPYTEALQGSENSTPAYDSQETVYTGILASLESAVAGIDESAEGFGSGDLIYGGDMSKWRKFANSLRVRIALRAVDVNESKYLAIISDAASSGVFESNADNAFLKYSEAQPYSHPLYENTIRDGRNDFSASVTMIDVLSSRNDPRIGQFFKKAENTDTFIGLDFGLTGEDAIAIPVEEVSQLSDRILAADFDGMLMDYAELSFALAEAKQRGANLASSAESYYDNGITASMNYWGIDDADAIDDYIDNNGYDAADFKNSIGIQKWISLYMQGYQGWFEWRRLDFEGVFRAPKERADDKIDYVVRRVYPSDELTLNSASVQNAIQTLQGGTDLFTVRLWWDVSAIPTLIQQ